MKNFKLEFFGKISYESKCTKEGAQKKCPLKDGY